MVADVVGYSHQMEADEAGTLARLKSHRAEFIDPLIAAHGGRLIKAMGDGLLIEFASAVEALACAHEVQQGSAARNGGLPDDQRVEYRIGINLGDIIAEDGDILGHGVNVASRLEGLAEPGGVWISRAVYDQVKGRLDLPLDYAGEHRVKNIEEPVQAYRLRTDSGISGGSAAIPAARTGNRHTRILWLMASAVLVAVGGLALGLGTDLLRPPPAGRPIDAADRIAAPALPDKPSIAILPFANMSDDPAQEYFSDGMTEDLITDLSKISGLFVVARNSTFSYKGKSVDVRQIASELGVRYVLEGSVRRAGEQVRINAQLIDATTGGHVWADRYDGNVEDVFGLQDRVTNRIVATMAVRLTADEEKRIALRDTENTDAYDSFLKGWEQYQRQTPEGFRQAIVHFEKAATLDPGYSRAHAALSATYWQAWKRYWHTEVGLHAHHDPRYKAEVILTKAIKNPTPLAYQVSAAMLSQKGLHDEAITEADRAVALDPNDPESYVALAGTLNLAGRPDEALRNIEQAMRLNPHYPPAYLYELGLARFGIESFGDAAEALEKATALNPDERWTLRLLIATYGQLGRFEAAATIMAKVESNWGGFDPLTVRGVAYWYPFREPKDAERLAEGLRKAGVPD